MHFILKLIYCWISLSAFSWLDIGGGRPVSLLSFALLFFLIMYVKLSFHSVLLLSFFIFTSFYDIMLCVHLGISETSSFMPIISQLCSEILFVYLISFFMQKTDDEKKRVIDLLWISITVYNLFVLIIFFFIPQLRPEIVLSDKFGIRLCGFTSANPNGYAYVCVFGVLIALHKLTKTRSWFVCLSFASGILAIVLIQSRAALFSIFVFALYEILCSKYKTQILKAGLGLTVVLLILGSVFALVGIGDFDRFFDEMSLSRFSDKRTEFDMYAVGASDFKNERGVLIQASLDTLSAHPWGIGSIDQVQTIMAVTGWDLVSHNIFIGYFLTYGFLVGFFWISLYVAMFFGTAVYFMHEGRNNPVFFLTSGMVVSVLIYLSFHIQNWYPFWVLMALHCSYLLQPKSNKTDVGKQNE